MKMHEDASNFVVIIHRYLYFGNGSAEVNLYFDYLDS